MNNYNIHFTIKDRENGNMGNDFRVWGHRAYVQANSIEEAWDIAKKEFRNYEQRGSVIEVTMECGPITVRKWSDNRATRNHFNAAKYEGYVDPIYEIGDDNMLDDYDIPRANYHRIRKDIEEKKQYYNE